MRVNFRLTVVGCALAGAISASTAAMADWHSPYFYRETNGSWTNVTYDDGICRYYFSHNSYDGQTNLNKYGDCSRIAIGPDGAAVPVAMYGAPVVRPGAPVVRPYGAPVVPRGRIIYGQE
jgi:hypothetical protein